MNSFEIASKDSRFNYIKKIYIYILKGVDDVSCESFCPWTLFRQCLVFFVVVSYQRRRRELGLISSNNQYLWIRFVVVVFDFDDVDDY